MSIMNNITRTIGKGKLTLKKKSPEILLAVGIISGGAALVCAIKETLKADTVIDEHREMMDKIEEAVDLAESEDDVEYSVEDEKKDKFKAYVKTGWSFAKLYAPTIILSAVSITCILTSHGIMRKRNVALAASLATVRTAYDEYRKRVIRDLGKEMDEHFLYDTVEEERVREVTDSKGKTKEVKETVKKAQFSNAYSRIYDACNAPDQWEKSGAANYIFIRSQMIFLQKKLIRDGYLFLNDVYKMLGFPITIAGQTAGWIYDYNDRDNTLFGIEGFAIDETYNSQAANDLMKGYENSIILNFLNIRDDILTDIPRVDSRVDVI